MTPFYSDAAVTLYLGDCRDFDGAVDAIVTDPPYARDALPLWEVLATVATVALRPGGWLLAYSGVAFLPEVIARLATTDLAYRWSISVPYEGAGDIVSMGEMTVLSEWKPVLVYRRRPFGSRRGERGRYVDGGRTGFRDLLRRGGREKAVHPWAQPLGEAMELLARFTSPGEVVLDPFAGSGTTLVAAKAMGRRAIGIEIDERWCEATAKRVSQEVLGLEVPA